MNQFFTLQNLNNLDLTATFSLANIFPHNQFWFNLFSFFSAISANALVWLGILFLIVYYTKLRYKELVFVFFIGLLLAWFLSDIALKGYFQRERPLNVILLMDSRLELLWRNSNTEKPVDYSFPSTHATTSVFAASVLAYYYKRDRKHLKKNWPLEYFFYTLALLVSYSRIYLGVHYLTDVTAGIILGLVLAGVVIKLASFLFRKA